MLVRLSYLHRRNQYLLHPANLKMLKKVLVDLAWMMELCFTAT